MARIQLDRSTLEAALIGLQLQRDEIENKIADLRRQLAGRDGTREAGSPPVRKRRGMSVAARKRIAAAQKKRWAEFRRKQKAA